MLSHGALIAFLLVCKERYNEYLSFFSILDSKFIFFYGIVVYGCTRKYNNENDTMVICHSKLFKK